MLLLTVKGSLGFRDLQFHNGVQYSTFKEACTSCGLIGDDQEWYDAFDEAAAWATSPHLRRLFVTMVLFGEVGDEYAFFEKVWRLLADDIQYQVRDMVGSRSYHMSDSDIRDSVLDELSTLFSNSGRSIREFNLPQRSTPHSCTSLNRLIMEEVSYVPDHTSIQANQLASLNSDQLRAFTTIVDAVLTNQPGFYFVVGYGGTGKTYLWKCIVNHLRAQKNCPHCCFLWCSIAPLAWRTYSTFKVQYSM